MCKCFFFFRELLIQTKGVKKFFTVRYKYGFRDPGIFSFGIQNPENSCLLDLQSWTLESAVHVKETGIPQTIGIPNPSSTEKESGIQ